MRVILDPPPIAAPNAPGIGAEEGKALALGDVPNPSAPEKHNLRLCLRIGDTHTSIGVGSALFSDKAISYCCPASSTTSCSIIHRFSTVFSHVDVPLEIHIKRTISSNYIQSKYPIYYISNIVYPRYSYTVILKLLLLYI